MNFIFILLISFILLAYVIQPLLQKKYKLIYVPFIKINEKEDLLEKKDEMLGALKEIEFEYQMGKLSKKDYNELKRDYEINALKILKELDTKNNGDSKNDLIEEEIKAFRFQKNKTDHKSEEKFKKCPRCETQVNINSKFCTNCGNSFVKEN